MLEVSYKSPDDTDQGGIGKCRQKRQIFPKYMLTSRIPSCQTIFHGISISLLEKNNVFFFYKKEKYFEMLLVT